MKPLKRILAAVLAALLLCGCAPAAEPAPIAATTLPVWEFAVQICQGTSLSVTRLVTEQVSCLHDYALNVRQVKAVEGAQVVIISGAGLEDFMDDLLADVSLIDAAEGISLLHGAHAHEEEEDDHVHGADADIHQHEMDADGHHHEVDPHIWLSPENAKVMASNICQGLSRQYPQYRENFQSNLEALLARLDTLQAYGDASLSDLGCRELVTFHDGFSYFAQAFGLSILEAVEEESGSEASAKDLIHLVGLVRGHSLPAVFTEVSGSTSAAEIIARETGCRVFPLDMAMAGDSYFDAMYRNIDTIKEALG